MSSSDDEGFGGLFAGADEPEPEYPIETLVVDRIALVNEGFTYSGFTPLLNRFDNIGAEVVKVEEAEAAIQVLRGRIRALQPPPLQVHYRNKRHSLWGHRLWNAAKYLTKRMDEGLINVYGKSVLELGAGLGVPTLAAFKNGARVAVVTDYPDAELLEMIQMNVDANCGSVAHLDTDVRARYEAEALRRVQAQEPGRASLTEEELRAAATTQCVVEPLLWGNKEHIRKALSYTLGGTGFDIVLLSDILFNHVCNDDLCDTLILTLAKNPTAAGYCVFSHHRAHMELKDYEFFDKCVAKGLQYEQIDQQDYELMFPEDRGPVEVRKPVKCYKITHRYDASGPALEAGARFDVVIQGTGAAQSYLSAALSRSGLKVLHCDAQGHYGGAFATFPLDQAAAAAGATVLVDRSANLSARHRRSFLVDTLPTVFMTNGEVTQQLARSDMARTLELHHVARLLFSYPEKAGNGGDSKSAAAAVTAVPLTRSEVFTTSAVGLLEKRRMMEFVRHIEDSLAEHHHARGANVSDDPTYNAEAAAAQEAKAVGQLMRMAAECPGATTLSALLEKKYLLSGTAADVLTLMGQLDAPADDSTTSAAAAKEEGEGEAAAGSLRGLARSVRLLRLMLTSVGTYGGSTPFLVPAYGAAEVPQNMCRISAVWGGTFVLRRSVVGVAVDTENDKRFAVLSNGQHVETRIIVAPSETAGVMDVQSLDWQSVWRREEQRASGELARIRQATLEQNREAWAGERDVRFARVVMAARAPLFSWDGLSAARVHSDPDKDYTDMPPVVQAFTRTAEGVVVLITQLTGSCEEAIKEGAVVHFTADASRLSQQGLQEFVLQHYCTGTPDSVAPGEEGGNAEKGDSADIGAPAFKLNFKRDIVFFAVFTVSALESAMSSLAAERVEVPSETRHTNNFSLTESKKLHEATEQDKRHLHRDIEEGKAGLRCGASVVEAEVDEAMVTLPTLRPSMLDDGQYLEYARLAYEDIITRLGLRDQGDSEDGAANKYVFLERLPPLPEAASF